ncbi:hypothetical protein MYCTH_2297134 [Thermothelomyces thermophilus ATCC 42464]|uniref:Uncharacterized protein n=1 Tax=Thermothelomyces thermophilus (strain ATCC 42464 / BCRC 31852 / DSM 1799) TaxID=573729 RepID=G2Q4L3_THET4|nr:uncharacterized protein MYCTH_2297134 [Thermothelomyces thermophilus ATCC 42464]AEO54502.1 hypothetical protein MYCTH_2297134 [Thermothelomyces thermophilus ATCC 42464]
MALTASTKQNAGPPSQTSTISPGKKQTPTLTPFECLQREFNDDLEYVSVEIAEKETRKMLRAKEGRKQYLPGQPRIRLNQPAHNADANEDKLLKYLRQCHNTDGLDELLPYMRYIFVQTPSHTHIMPLHHQKSHAREIRVTESPGLHLVWYYELIFIKPIPAYFYSQAFWDYLENADKKLYGACLGFMRSYYMLIQYNLDFELACNLRLIPPKGDGTMPTYEEWCDFIEPFSQVGDAHVNRRYHYGELRLTRINRAAVLFKFNLAYFHIYPQWGSFLEHTLAPIITVFAVCSVVLNSMQVSLAVIEIKHESNQPLGGAWPRFMDASLWFPVVVMVSIAVILIAALCGMGIMGLKDLFRGNYVRKRKKKGDPSAGTRSHGMVW